MVQLLHFRIRSVQRMFNWSLRQFCVQPRTVKETERS